MKTVGVLALQGDFLAHVKVLEQLGAKAIEVRTAAELSACHGLIIPGGESTTMLKLLTAENLLDPLREFLAKKPGYGTCAGAILLASEVNHPEQPGLAVLDIAVERNGYGRQVDSRVVQITMENGGSMEAVFIRAPIIRRTGNTVQILARYQGDPVWVKQGKHMATTFHPELSSTGDLRVHREFLAGM
jgi:pyridoxal 5'-phosphate synthase pdxT subunit